jgi:esterase/lipase
MYKQNFRINNIPAVLWGEKSQKLIIAVHGDKSSKSDTPIAILAQEAVTKGYQVLSFDLPEHGDRINEPTLCKVQNCVGDLGSIIRYAKKLSDDISLFACSMGAYFSLLAYKNEPIRQSLFLSPVVDMHQLIKNMMMWFNIDEERLKSEQEIPTPVGKTLYWDYYCYVKQNPITNWHSNTSILYGLEDNLTEYDVITEFANRFDSDLKVVEHGEHYFHTVQQLECLTKWIEEKLG